ncbi:hypothetical protein AVEN_113168-1 [Araneus ventricosus]|uniref:DDE Tnp4 domain-containing protein n=1 Tax=Araneus ventricosus TaxID=182803 RepID=A0A4Y2P0C4_ARAVE|nr:hypothetical protein AVEN_113168-1 [Araneus ventricosus]
MENYCQWMLTKNVKRLRLKTGTVPHRFDCQKRHIPSPIERQGAKKRKHLSLIEEVLSSPVSLPSTSTNLQDECLEMNLDENTQVNKSLQVDIKTPFKSKGTMTTPQVISVACSPIKGLETVQNYNLSQKVLDESSAKIEVDNFKIDILVENSESEYECPDESSSEDELFAMEQYKKHMLIGTIMSIEKKPKIFLGLPPRSFYLIKLITEDVPLPTNHIYVVLKKLRLNMSFTILALDFGLSVSSISRIFCKSLPVLAKIMQDLIVWPDKRDISRHLPIPFRARYAKVQSIIDCLEIQIEKPSNPVHQAHTWSNYYSCNTIKYLLSCTPDGLVSFVSEGYGGRRTDCTIVEDSGFLNKLSPGALVMADRGFKNVSVLLEQRGCSLVRPPSVSSSTRSTKSEVRQSKQIAALRIHVERVIGRLRDFTMLSPHACVDNHFIPVLDLAVIVSCGIINMQDHLIKKQI